MTAGRAAVVTTAPDPVEAGATEVPAVGATLVVTTAVPGAPDLVEA